MLEEVNVGDGGRLTGCTCCFHQSPGWGKHCFQSRSWPCFRISPPECSGAPLRCCCPQGRWSWVMEEEILGLVHVTVHSRWAQESGHISAVLRIQVSCVYPVCFYFLSFSSHRWQSSFPNQKTPDPFLLPYHILSLGLKTQSVVFPGVRSLCVSLALLDWALFCSYMSHLSGIPWVLFYYGDWLFVWWWEKGVPRQIAHGHTLPVGILCLNTLVRTGRTTRCILLVS